MERANFPRSCFDRFDLKMRVNVCDESPWWEVFDGSEETVLDFLSVIQNTLSRADKGDEGVGTGLMRLLKKN